MLKLTFKPIEKYDELTNTFQYSDKCVITLEHSLVSLSKWESKWHKPFLTKDEKTLEETIDYIKCMTVTKNVDEEVYSRLTNEHLQAVRDYIENPMTATTFSNLQEGRKINREIITSEIIYYWMTVFNIPFECEKWHLNRLLTLINVCNIKNSPPKKMGKKEIYQRNKALNMARRRFLNTGG